MKKYFIFLIVLVSMISCEKDSITISKVTAFINGNTWKSFVQTAVVVDNNLTITATNAEKQVISMVVKNVAVGTFELSLTSQQCELIYTPVPTNLQDTYVGATGTVTINSLSTTSVSGTFDFHCRRSSNVAETLEITNGQFTNLRILHTGN